jgi:hypothetical protein
LGGQLSSEHQHESLIDLLRDLHILYNEGSVVTRETLQEKLHENLSAVGSPIVWSWLQGTLTMGV